jgi:glyceraldehyde 3-phosphate dehydrogenase
MENKIKTFVNGMGRIGHLAFVYAIEKGSFDIVGVNDPAAMLEDGTISAANIVGALTHDSVHKKLYLGHVAKVVEGKPDHFTFDGKEYRVYAEKDPSKLPLKELGVDLVLECSGRFNSTEKLAPFYAAGAKGVIINSPAKDSGMKTVVYGVNQSILNPEDKAVSGASCTTNCLTPVLDAFRKKFSIVFADMVTIHAFTPSQNAVDGVSKKPGDERIARSVENNIIPTTTGARKATSLVIPELKDKMEGYAVRVPVNDGAYISCDLLVDGVGFTAADVNAHMKSCASDTLDYVEDPFLVSQDIIDNTHGSIFDALLTKVFPIPEKNVTMVRLCAWYDNESSYTRQYIRTAEYYGRLISK